MVYQKALLKPQYYTTSALVVTTTLVICHDARGGLIMKTKVAVKSSFASNERESSKTSHIHSHEHKSWSAKNERMQIVYEAKRIKQERITLSET